MKLGFGPLSTANTAAADTRTAVVLLESKGYEFVVLAGTGDAIIAAAIAAPVTGDIRLLVTLDRPIDPVRDAEDLAVLDQISGGRVAIVLGPRATDEVALAEKMLRGLAGGIVHGVRVFPRPAQLSIPAMAPAEHASRLGAVPMSDDVLEDHFVTLSLADLPPRRDDILARAPFALCVKDESLSGLEGLATAQHLREELFVDAKARRTSRRRPQGDLGPSDLSSPIHRI